MKLLIIPFIALMVFIQSNCAGPFAKPSPTPSSISSTVPSLVPLVSSTPIKTPVPKVTNLGPGTFLFFEGGYDSTLAQYATALTILSTGLTSDPALAALVPKSNRAQLGDSIAAVGADAADPNVGIPIYDIEHWPATPIAEQKNPVSSISKAADAAHAHGKPFGIAPDGQFIGLIPGQCAFNLSKGILAQLDYTKIQYVNLQEQRLGGNSCPPGLFAKFATEADAIIKAKNPNIIITHQISFRDSDVSHAEAAIDSVKTFSNGIYIAMPSSDCPFCSSSNLSQTLGFITKGG